MTPQIEEMRKLAKETLNINPSFTTQDERRPATNCLLLIKALEIANKFIDRIAGPIGSGCDIGSRQHMAQLCREDIEVILTKE